MTAAPATATVLDTTVPSNFAHVDRVDLLVDLPRVVTVPAVEIELEAGTETHTHLERALAALDHELPVVTPSASAQTLESVLLGTLDPGAAQALAVAETVDGMVVTDDGDARTVANERGTDVTGSIGLLVRSVERGQLSEATADTHLKRWIDEAGFRSPSRDVETFVTE